MALAWHGGFSPLSGKVGYYGRYAQQGSFDRVDVQALIDQGYAETQGPNEPLAAVFPTRAGLEEAARRSPPKVTEHDRVLAVLGSRNWEVESASGAALVGLYLTENSVTKLINDLLGALSAPTQQLGVYVETIGGAIPPELTADLQGEPVDGAPHLELTQLPKALEKLVNLGRRYRFLVDVRRNENTATLFQWAGANPRLLSGLPLPSLAAALKATAPGAAGLPELEAQLSERQETESGEVAP